MGVCRFKEVIECSDRRRCEKCGWNPKVEKQRKVRIHEERAKLPEANKNGLVRCEECMYRPKLLKWCLVHDRKVEMTECCVHGVRRE